MLDAGHWMLDNIRILFLSSIPACRPAGRQHRLNQDTYRFEPVRRVWTPDGTVYRWASQDAPVLKAMALVLNEELKPHVSSNGYHHSILALLHCGTYSL